MLQRFAKGMKDGALGIALKAFLNERLKEYGDVLDCEVDTGRGRISIRAHLRGDRDPITATVERYELVTEGESVFATLQTFSSSRPWLTLLLGKLFTGKRYKLPNAVAGLL